MSFEEHISTTIKQAVADALAAQAHPAMSISDLVAGSGIIPGKVYSTKEVARILGTNRVESVSQIPEELLPSVRRLGNRKGFMGINILCYIHELDPVDTKALTEQLKQEYMQSARPKIKPINPGPERVRVL